MATILLPTDFKDFLKLLNENAVEYLLVGGYAVGHHGYPRATGDMDIWIERSAPNSERVAAALRGFGFSSEDIAAEVFREADRVVRMGNPPLRIEVLTSVSGVEFADCWVIREITILDGVPVNMIDIQSLKTNKQASGRLKDLNGLKHLP
jgi:hypothetical protein